MSRKIIDLKKGDAILFQKQGDKMYHFGRVVEISENQTKAVVESKKSKTEIDNSYKVFKVY